MKATRQNFAISLLGCLFLLSGAGSTQAGPVKEKPKYTMASGKGWSICEAYLKFLNSLPPTEETLRCDLKLKQVPGMREPDWQELDIAKNLPIVHQIELVLGVGHFEFAPEKDFERWKIQREAHIKKRGEQPRLRRARLAVAANGAVETVLSYNVDIKQCEKQVAIAKAGKPFNYGLGEPNFFIFDEAKQRVLGSSGYWVATTEGVLTLFQGKPYYLELVLGGFDNGASASLLVKRLEPVPFSGVRELSIPNNPLYDSHELCRIRFDTPFPSFDLPPQPR